MDDQSSVDISDIKNVVKFRIVNDTTTIVTFPSIPSSNKYFVITAYDRGYNESNVSNEATIIVTSIEEEENIIDDFRLEQNYPNPFNPSTKIRYAIPLLSDRTPLEGGARGGSINVQLKVYDVLGNEIATLVNEEKPAGIYEVEFDASKLPSGIYFYRLQAGNFTDARKMMLLR